MSIVDNYYKHNVFFVEELMALNDLEHFELGVFNTVPLSSAIYNYPAFMVADDYTRTDIIECYQATANPAYRLFQMLIAEFKRKDILLLWLGSPIFFGQL